jgi:hypothetical protein
LVFLLFTRQKVIRLVLSPITSKNENSAGQVIGRLATCDTTGFRHSQPCQAWAETPVERRLGDAAGVVRDRGRRDCRDHLKKMVLAEAGREESIDVLVVETSALFDHRLRQSRQRCEFAVLRRTILTNGLRSIDAFLERQRRMKRDGAGACIDHRIGEQNDLDRRFRKAAVVRLPWSLEA